MPDKVTIYTASYCPYCAAAKRLLDSKKMRYTEIDVTDDDAMREKLVKMTGGRETVPQVFFGPRHIGGYDDLVRYLADPSSFK